MFAGFLTDNIAMGMIQILCLVMVFSFWSSTGFAMSCEEVEQAQQCQDAFGSNEMTAAQCATPTFKQKRDCGLASSARSAGERARAKAKEMCQKAGEETGKEGAQALENGQPIEDGNTGSILQSSFECKCPEMDEPRQINADLSCDPNKESEDKEGDEENPFECAEGGGGAAQQQAQAAQQALQKRAQMENQCNQVYEQARVDCDPDSSVGFQGMLDEALAKAEKAKSAEKGDAKKACDDYTKAFKKASGELKSFRTKCASRKASCLSTCNQSVAVNGEMNPIMAVLGACMPMIGMIGQMMAQANNRIEQVQLKSCNGFEAVLLDADRKQKELVESMRMADKCQTELKESCSNTPTAAHCRSLETADTRGEDLQEVDTSVERTPKFKLDTPPLGDGGAQIAKVDGKGKGANVKQASGASGAKLGSAGGGNGAASSRGGGGGYYSEYDDLYGRMKGDSYSKAPRGGRRGGGSYKGPRSRNFKRKKKGRKTAGTGLDLKKYMNGGTGRKMVDGITPAAGPGIFEKVSNRYKVKKGSLLRK